MSARYAYVYTPAVIVWGVVVVPAEAREYELVWQDDEDSDQATHD